MSVVPMGRPPIISSPLHNSYPMVATRRQFIKATAFAAAATVAPQLLAHELAAKPFLEISLAEWSFHKVLFSNKMSNLDFPVVAK